MRWLAVPVLLLALLGARPAVAVDHADRLAAFRERYVNWTTATPALLAQQLADKFVQATGMKITVTRQDGDDALRRAVEQQPARKGGIDVITLAGPGAAVALAGDEQWNRGDFGQRAQHLVPRQAGSGARAVAGPDRIRGDGSARGLQGCCLRFSCWRRAPARVRQSTSAPNLGCSGLKSA